MSVRMAPPLPLIFLLIIHISGADWGVKYSPSHICALKDSSVIMSCTYKYPTGHQIMKVFWTKDLVKHGEEFADLSEDPEYSQRLQYLGDKQQNCTVRLSHVTEKDEHKYYFRFITNITTGRWIGIPGERLSVTDLQLESPERVTEGDSVRLTCRSSCKLTDTPTFIWYRNSQRLTERRDRSNELLLQSVRREDAGRYRCAVHEHTLTSPEVYLNVMYSPKSVSVSISGSAVIMEGDSVTLSCSSDSNPPAEINWFKGIEYVKYGRIFNISKISSDNGGEYKCRARNKHGEKYSDPVTLDVQYSPRNVSVSINGSAVIVSGDSVSLMCISDSNPPALSFSWFKENQSSAVGSGQSFSAVQSGRFYCEAHNPHGAQRSDAVTVTVKGRPLILYISIGVGCGAAVVIMILLIWKNRMKIRNDTEESQINQSRLHHDRNNDNCIDFTEPMYENIKMNPSRPHQDRLTACDVQFSDPLYENIKMNPSRIPGGTRADCDVHVTDPVYGNVMVSEYSPH
ncbi:B-cell receptor CD22-like isoform X2 [Danio rerio]|uniref:B-cell receptor CD22-like isoform X2 n=1 Tax=Danio rerio TaxID=7955 RepID=A0AC58G2G1_DANRE